MEQFWAGDLNERLRERERDAEQSVCKAGRREEQDWEPLL